MLYVKWRVDVIIRVIIYVSIVYPVFVFMKVFIKVKNNIDLVS